MFVDDIMILGSGIFTEWCVVLDILKNLFVVSGLTINNKKPTLYLWGFRPSQGIDGKATLDEILSIGRGN